MTTSTPRSKKNFTEQQRHQILWTLTQDATGGNPRHGAICAVAAQFGVIPRTVSRIWQSATAMAAVTGVLQAPSRKRTTGRKKKDYDAALERLRDTSPEARSTVLAVARVGGIPANMLHRRIREGCLRVAKSVSRPLLTDANKLQRVQFSCAHVDPTSLLFIDMYDKIHVDDKLFI